MPQPITVELRGKRDRDHRRERAKILEEMPEIAWIKDERCARRSRMPGWRRSASSSFSRIGDMKPSGNYDFASAPARHAGRSHALGHPPGGQDRRGDGGLFPDFSYDRDLLIAGCLCHDIGKVWEFDPENVKRWKANPRATGMPSLRHPGYGIHICLTMGLPEEVAHMAAAHSGEGDLLVRSLENTILHWADYTFWRVVEASDQFADQDPWLDGELVRTQRATGPLIASYFHFARKKRGSSSG